MRINSLWAIVSLTLCITMALGGLVLYILWPNTVKPIFYQGQNKVWSHRTLADGEPENSISGLRRAFALGAPGVEIDIIYNVLQNRFYVISGEAITSGQPAVLNLTDMLSAVPPHGLVWLDFWNLKHLSPEESRRATNRLQKELDDTNMLNRAIVESMSSEKLGLVASWNMQTCLWLDIRPWSAGHLAHLRDLIIACIQFRSANYSAVSLDYTQYDNSVGFLFARVPIHLFTVNDIGTLCKFSRDPRIKVILSDFPYFADLDCKD